MSNTNYLNEEEQFKEILNNEKISRIKDVATPERNPWLEHDAIPFQKYRKLLFSKHYMVLYQI